ncbi:MAG: glycosyltransferase family 4 protein [Candidatus Levybacteria bacterium]|nr:glycosyltransferase family 4 protein [Candidatus Levybacteria bacterium]
MRLAILGSVALSVPPPAQGGTEWIAYYQAKGLGERGHKVLLLASKGTAVNFQNVSNIEVIEVGGGDVVAGSSTENNFDTHSVESSRRLRLETVYLSEALEKLIERKDDYDVVLNNMRGEAVFLPIAKLLNKPFVNVMHLNLFPELAQLFSEFNTSIITISNAQRKEFPDLNYSATVYNCVDVDKYSFNPTPEGYLLMVGTIGRHKNQGEAIAVAKELGLKLILAGKIRDQDYFEELKKNIDGKQIKYLSEVGLEEKVKLYQNARAFLFPILWEEPFGLVMIEAMACGTPVVAFNHGAVSEVVRDGLTGYVVENHSQMVEAVKKIDAIDRTACRKHVEENFSISKMIDEYEKALQKLIAI